MSDSMSLLADKIKVYFVISLHHHVCYTELTLTCLSFPDNFFAILSLTVPLLPRIYEVLPKHC